MGIREKIRIDSGLKMSDVAKANNVSRQYIWQYENYKRNSIKLDIYYFELRGTDTDKIIVEYLKEKLKG